MTPHTMPGPIVFHCKSTQVRNGGKIEILEELERLSTMLGTRNGEKRLCCKRAGVLRSVPDSLTFFPSGLCLLLMKNP